MTNHIYWQKTKITREDRQELNAHRSFVLWFTGLSGAGKTTLASAVEQTLYDQNVRSYILDGDNIRHGLSKDLGFTEDDRRENIRRIGEVSKLMMDAGLVVLTAFISPYRADRDIVRSLLKQDEFIEVFVDCPLDVCEKRDPKGLYKKARSGEIRNFTGIDSIYEAPVNPDLHIKTGEQSVEESVKIIVDYIESKKLIRLESR